MKRRANEAKLVLGRATLFHRPKGLGRAPPTATAPARRPVSPHPAHQLMPRVAPVPHYYAHTILLSAQIAEWYVHKDLCNKTLIRGFVRHL